MPANTDEPKEQEWIYDTLRKRAEDARKANSALELQTVIALTLIDLAETQFMLYMDLSEEEE